METELLRFTTAGSVDDGKSTLIGRLLHDSNAVYEDQLDSVRKVSRDGIDLALLTDGLRAEREQGITIDVAYRYFSTPRRKFIIADTPGHEEYTRNMATGASTADLALVLLDARKGVLTQTRRHACIAWLLGIRHIVFVINKMDAVGYSQEVFDNICGDLGSLSRRLEGCTFHYIPVSALAGDNVVRSSSNMPWFRGCNLLEYLETVQIEDTASIPDFRLPVQYVIRNGGDFRAYAGQIAAGSVREGDEVMILPSRQITRVRTICALDENLKLAHAPMSVALCLDGQFDVSRGCMLASPLRPPEVADHVRATLIWMGEEPLRLRHPYLVKHTSQRVCAQVSQIDSVLDVDMLAEHPAASLRMNEIGTVQLETHLPLFFDAYKKSRGTGSFVLIDPITNRTVAAGMLSGVAQTIPSAIDKPLQSGVTVWFTGLSSAGKSTISQSVYERLWAMGYKVEHLDGDVVRRHLSKDLGFTQEDRNENVRRIGFVADLLAKNGVVVLVSMISPYRAIRDELRSKIESFIEVYVNAPLAVCEQRDVKGLYSKARAGLLPRFTGVSDPYEPPLHSEIECRTDRETLAESVAKVIEYLEAHFQAPSHPGILGREQAADVAAVAAGEMER
ncbi:MAG TPA: adenylyl-sulfate kinase [Candidatus Angelobacter sp.]|nr:adenylyl-sulfate kinase [Candidatus Angelobacter sp.]